MSSKGSPSRSNEWCHYGDNNILNGKSTLFALHRHSLKWKHDVDDISLILFNNFDSSQTGHIKSLQYDIFNGFESSKVSRKEISL